MSMLTGRVEAVIGVDTHKQQHTAALVDALGGQRGLLRIVSDGSGYRQLLGWGRRLEPGRRVWAVEGTGSFGAGLSSYLLEAGEWVCEVDRPDKPARKRGAKSDQIDALRAARQALQAEHLSQPRGRGEREAIRVLKLGRQQAVEVRAEAVVQLKSLVVSAPEGLRARLRGLPTGQLVKTCAGLRQNRQQSLEWRATVATLRSLARRAEAAAKDVEELSQSLAEQVAAEAPQLLAEKGVGTVVAAQLLCAWSHPGRLRSEAAFAMLAGVAPIPTSSGQKERYRLNRSGDREVNCALRTVVITRLASDPRTQAYFARRRAQGKSDREIQRCLKRYLARRLFRVMESNARS
jgi:transposase